MGGCCGTCCEVCCMVELPLYMVAGTTLIVPAYIHVLAQSYTIKT